MHYLGMCGLPRRVCSYDASFSWLNAICSLGSFISGVRAFFLFFILWESVVVGNRVVGAWGGKFIILSIATLPLGHHIEHLSTVSRWSYLCWKFSLV